MNTGVQYFAVKDIMLQFDLKFSLKMMLYNNNCSPLSLIKNKK